MDMVMTPSRTFTNGAREELEADGGGNEKENHEGDR
jgi:hypothetical protein